MKLGIAITTLNRAECLLEQIRMIQKFSVSEYELIVCDDGSSDNTIDLLEKENISYISSENKGIAWNKNRGIYYLTNYTSVDAFILLDDDIYPTMYGWDIEWGKAAQLHGSVTFIIPEWKKHLAFGNCTACNPGLTPIIAGSSIAFSREAFPFVGYMDNRFGRYGHEHTDYSTRYVKAGFGGLIKNDKSILYAVVDSGLELIPIVSNGSTEEANRNEPILHRLSNEPLFRQPWFNDQQQQAFLSEFKDIGYKITIPEWDILRDFDREFYLATYPDVRASGIDPVKHYYLYGRHENRKNKPDPTGDE
ncbi:glycosyltransferase family 2 protein [Commensalibacter oyaizuii]|uniref:Glycosyltransferase n=1 Tax=Commensalibacter oyaizuii TaxID=3043873 RepID=A0ABT6Q267_9PROT|nr:glycosyltransferase [Commensalibacter sp. TBRC 16381]MDI2091213.1 glycosyltransferase [Commensalibacter sp. TBRC 16381]